MAKLGSFYGLCPIIDEKSLLGVNEDIEPGCVLVTLGKNIAIKYKLADQKQLISWRTKDKFTSPVIYYKEEEKYCSIFNHTFIKIWNAEIDNIDKQKKYKFNIPILTLLVVKEDSFIVFKNGNVCLLKEALENRRGYNPTSVIDVEKESIIDVLCVSTNNKIYIGLVIKSEEELYLTWTVYSNGKFEEHTRIMLSKPGTNLAGYVLLDDTDDDLILLTLCSDGKLYLHNLENLTDPTLISVIKYFSYNHNVTMTRLNRDYIAMYGADSNQEGASLIIYNVQLRTLQHKQSYKMFRNTTKLWCLQKNLFLCIGQNLAVVPYHVHEQQLASLLGSQLENLCDDEIEIVEQIEIANWETTGKEEFNSLNGELLKFSERGRTEKEICETLIPNYIEKNDLKAIEIALEKFLDIPELCLIKILNYLLNSDTIKTKKLIKSILNKKYNDSLLLPYLRTIDMKNSITLLNYISNLLGENIGSSEDEISNKKQIIKWANSLLDANYQRFLASTDEEIQKVIINFAEIVNKQLTVLDNLIQLKYLIEKVTTNNYEDENVVKSDTKYSVEKLILF